MKSPIVILGTGLAGLTVAREVRKLDPEVPLTLVTADHGDFYSKPSLSNALAAGKAPAQLVLTPREMLAQQLDVEIRSRLRVTAIRPAERQIDTSTGAISYGKLVLAVGAQPIRLPIGGDGAGDILSVNHLDDYALFRSRLDVLPAAATIAILGAGLIGCEFANDLRAAGYGVTVFDVAPQPLGRLLPPQAASFFRHKLEAAGVSFHFSTSIDRVDRLADRWVATDSQGGRHHVDLVLSAIGLRPETTLAAATGLAVQRGIVVDRLLESSVPGIYALGDCAEVNGQVLPFVLPIMQGARALAKTLTGMPTEVSYPAMPVMVKTPACPAAVCPPPSRPGSWSEESTPDGLRALYRDPLGKLLGFALLGDAAPERQKWVTEVPGSV